VRVPSSQRALCAPEHRVGATPGPASLACGPREQGAGQGARLVSQAKHFGAVAETQQVENALCAWAELGFGP
jgi:hypothetical protein